MTVASVIKTVLERLDAAFLRTDALGRLYGAFRGDVHKLIIEALTPLAPLMAKVGSWTATVQTEPLRRLGRALVEAARDSDHQLAAEWRKMAREAREELDERERATAAGAKDKVPGRTDPK